MKEKIENKYRSLKKWYGRYINGFRGSVSIFLVLVLLPFMSIALILVESARYQSTVELVDEMMDCLGLSTLSDYDKYLEDRFGFLALSQKTPVNTSYSGYYDANANALNNAFTKTSLSATGVYPLSDKDVFKQQLEEYCEVMSVSEALYKGLNIEDMIKELYKKLKLDDLKKFADATKKVADVATSVADLVNAIKDLVKKYKSYKSALSEYNTAQTDFINKIDALQKQLKTAEENLGEDDEEKDIYSDKDVKDKIDDFKTARNTFSREAGEMATAVGDMKKAVDDCFGKLDKITSNIEKAKTSMDKLDEPSLKDQTTTTTSEWVIAISDELTSILKTSVSDTYGADMTMQQNALKAQKTAVSNVLCDAEVLTNPKPGKYYIKPTTSIDVVKIDFARITLDSIQNGFDTKLETTLKDLDNNKSSIEDDERGKLTKLLDVAADLLKIKAFYDGSLDSNVSGSVFVNASSMSFSSQVIITSLTTIVTAGEDFVDSLGSLNILKALKAAAELLIGIAEFLVAIVSWIVEFTVNLVKMFVNIKDMYDNFMFASYAVYNLPCRTTYDSGKSLSGYSFSKVFSMFGGVKGNAFSGSLKDLNTLLNGDGGSDEGFKGAEAEYVLIGGKNELLNQSAAFFDVYMFRMILDLISIFKNDQVKAMASAATVASWVVYIALIIAEPMIDTIMLVNGQDVYLIKDQIYLTPGGLILLLETLPSLSGLSESSKSKIKDSMIAKNGEAKASGFGKMNYQEYLMILMMVSLDQSTLLNRIQNLVQMEAKENYQGDYNFTLTNANTMIRATIKGRLNSMFDLKALIENGPFTISTTRYTGY